MKENKNQQENLGFMLSIDHIKEIPFDKYDKNFLFIVNGKEYYTTRIIADILSPIIRQYHFTDGSIDQFCINTINQNNKSDFSQILSLINSDEKILTKEEVEYFTEIFIKLGNRKEIDKLILKHEEEITTENVFNLLDTKQIFLQQFYKSQNESNLNDMMIYKIKEEIQTELDFISSHFFELDEENILNLDVTLFESIIKSDTLELEDEDTLLKMINEIYSRDSKYAYLYSYVKFLFVSENELENFYSIFDLKDISIDIWRSIFERSTKSQLKDNEIEKYKQKQRRYKKHKQKQDDGQQTGIPLFQRENEEFNGIIQYLTNQTGGNIHDNGTIEVTSNSYYSWAEPKNLLEFNYNENFNAFQNNDVWICFDFKDRKVKITNYSIKSNNTGPNGCHLKSWNLEVSNDGETWIRIDERRNCQELNGSRLTGNFQTQSDIFARYVRLHQMDKTWSGDCLWFWYLEFFGYLL